MNIVLCEDSGHGLSVFASYPDIARFGTEMFSMQALVPAIFYTSTLAKFSIGASEPDFRHDGL
jgi:hypothetical protein